MKTRYLPLVAGLGLALIACGDDGSVADASGDATALADVDVTAGSDADATAEIPPEVTPTPCDLTAQDCPDDHKCSIGVEDNGTVVTRCVALLGTAGVGESCSAPNDDYGEDTCAAGAICTWAGLPLTDPQGRHCVPLCTGLGTCEDPARECRSLGYSTDYGLCDRTCDPFGADCPPETKCGYSGDAMTNGIVFVCDFIGPAGEDDVCDWSRDCDEGLHCLQTADGWRCIPFCNGVTPCDNPAQACFPMSLSAVTEDSLGHCTPVSWDCLANPPAAPTEETATVALQVADCSVGVLPAAGATVRACAAVDVGCTAPLDAQTAADDGSVTLTVPLGATGFPGYFEVSQPGLMPFLAYADPPIAGPGVELYVPLVDVAALDALLPEGVAGDPSRGTVWARFGDCRGVSGTTVTVAADTADDQTVTAYGAYTADRFDDQVDRTGWDSDGLLLNLPVGPATVSATVAADGAEVYTRTFEIRAGAVTWVESNSARRL